MKIFFLTMVVSDSRGVCRCLWTPLLGEACFVFTVNGCLACMFCLLQCAVVLIGYRMVIVSKDLHAQVDDCLGLRRENAVGLFVSLSVQSIILRVVGPLYTKQYF